VARGIVSETRLRQNSGASQALTGANDFRPLCSPQMADAEKTAGRGWFRRTLLQIEIGAAIGIAGWAFAGSDLLTWMRYKTPVDQPNSCQKVVQSALNDFTQYQLISAAAGVALVLIIGNLSRKKSVKPSAPSSTAPTV
jgi:hypothetical protein